MSRRSNGKPLFPSRRSNWPQKLFGGASLYSGEWRREKRKKEEKEKEEKKALLKYVGMTFVPADYSVLGIEL